MERLPPTLASALSSITVILMNSTAAITVNTLTTLLFIVNSFMLRFRLSRG
jgi:hypothetical protein